MDGSTDFEKHVLFELGNGVQIQFWHNIWCLDVSLLVVFPDLFCIATDKNALVADYLTVLVNGLV